MTGDPNSLAARRRSLGRLLDYSLSEAGDLGLDDVAQFLLLAAAALEGRCKEPAPRKPRRKPAGEIVISLADFLGEQSSTIRRSPSRSTRK